MKMTAIGLSKALPVKNEHKATAVITINGLIDGCEVRLYDDNGSGSY